MSHGWGLLAVCNLLDAVTSVEMGGSARGSGSCTGMFGDGRVRGRVSIKRRLGLGLQAGFHSLNWAARG